MAGAQASEPFAGGRHTATAKRRDRLDLPGEGCTPGLGLLLYQALVARDSAVVQGAALVIVFGYLTFTAHVDALAYLVDPRLADGAPP